MLTYGSPILSEADPHTLPGLPVDDNGPVFDAPWQAQAFALVINLAERGVIAWQEWTGYLVEEINAAQQGGDADLGDSYYEHWLRALERISLDKQLTSLPEVDQRSNDWRRSYLATPHGQPVSLIQDSEVDSKRR